MSTLVRRSPVLAVGVIVGLVFAAAELVGGGEAWRAALAGIIPIGYSAVVTVIGRRNDTVSVLAGTPIDERAEHLNQEASAWSLGVTAIVVLGAFVVTESTRGDWAPYAFVAAVMALAYMGSLVILQARH